MGLFVLFIVTVGLSYLAAWLLTLFFRDMKLVKGLIVLDLTMWSAAYYLIDQIDHALVMHNLLCDLMFPILYIIMIFGVMRKRWVKKNDVFRA